MKFFTCEDSPEFGHTPLVSVIEAPPSDIKLSKYWFGNRIKETHDVITYNSTVGGVIEALQSEAAEDIEPNLAHKNNKISRFLSSFKSNSLDLENDDKEQFPSNPHFVGSRGFDSSGISDPNPDYQVAKSKTTYLQFLSTNFDSEKIDKNLIGNQRYEEDEIFEVDPEKTYRFQRPCNRSPFGQSVQKKIENKADLSNLASRDQSGSFSMESFLKKVKPKKGQKTPSTSTSKKHELKIKFKRIKPI
jgi:hypothetical protein